MLNINPVLTAGNLQAALKTGQAAQLEPGSADFRTALSADPAQGG